MATWHQQRNPAGLQALWKPHPTEWKCVSDKHNQFASSMSFTDETEARAYAKRTGNVLIPPASARS